MINFLRKLFLILSIIALISTTIFAQTIGDDNFKYETKIYKKGIKTLEAAREDWELSYPIMSLNSQERLKISFDFLSQDINDFYYTFIHCDANWQPSNLIFSEYCNGFEENTINEYSYSFNTFASYVNYKVYFPNEDISPLISGNYLFVVYEEGNIENIVLTQRIFIADSKVRIEEKIKRSITSDLTNAGQRVNFTLFSDDVSLDAEYVKVVVQQNGRVDNAKNNLKPQFSAGGELIYQSELENVFSAGNEFRHIDLKDETFLAMGIEDIYYIKPFYHYKLEIDYSRNKGSYISKQDINGDFFIQKDRSTESYKDADYFYVHFRLNNSNELLGGDVYLVGAHSNWNLIEENKMVYNFNTKNYEAKLFLKQGYYNYAYAYKAKKTGKIDYYFFEGSFSETENKYIIYVYDINPVNNYHELIGVKIVSTMQN